MAKNKLNLKTAQQMHGKLEPETTEYEPTTLDQIWGDTGLSKYNTVDLEEYENQLNDLNPAELRRHAIEVAHIVPHSNFERLRKSLVLEFKKHVNGFRQPKITHKPEKKPSKEALRIMAECK